MIEFVRVFTCFFDFQVDSSRVSPGSLVRVGGSLYFANSCPGQGVAILTPMVHQELVGVTLTPV